MIKRKPRNPSGDVTKSGTRRSPVRRSFGPVMAIAGALALGGCAAPVIGAITVSQLSTAAGIASSIMSGRSPAEHLVSAIAGEDCRFMEAILRGRPICVPYGTPEADESFQGIIVALRGDADDAEPREVQVAGLDPAAVQLGFAPIVPDYDITTGAIAAVERDIHDSKRGDMRRVSFGMMSATYGPSHSMDDLLAERAAMSKGKFLRPADGKAGTESVQGNVILAAAEGPVMNDGPTPLAAKRSDGAVITPEVPRSDRLDAIVERAVMAPIPD